MTTTTEILDPQECRRLLQAHLPRVGRLGFVGADDTVLVLPVNYAVTEDGIAFRTDNGSKMAAVVDGRELTFEVDEVDAAWRDGWSVLVHGPAEIVIDPAERTAILERGLWAWAGASTHVVLLRPRVMSGRRIS